MSTWFRDSECGRRHQISHEASVTWKRGSSLCVINMSATLRVSSFNIASSPILPRQQVLIPPSIPSLTIPL